MHVSPFISPCYCSVSPSRAIAHSFLALNSVNLSPVLHQFISLWSCAGRESRDYQRPTSAVVPISAFCQTGFIKIKGFFLPFASLSFSPSIPLLKSAPYLSQRCESDWMWKKGFSPVLLGARGHDLKELRPQISSRSCISGLVEGPKAFQ